MSYVIQSVCYLGGVLYSILSRIMLFCVLVRGLISVVDIGENKAYFLYTNLWYYLVSPTETKFNPNNWNVRIGQNGNIYSEALINGGGVHFLELCYYRFYIFNRGSVANDNDTTQEINREYYLNTDRRYSTISHFSFSNSNPYIINVYSSGALVFGKNDSIGGVQVFRVML